MEKRTKYLLLLLMLFPGICAFAQKPKSQWGLSAFSEKRYYLGFAFSLNQTFYSLQLRDPQPNDSIYNIDMEGQAGFSLGLAGVLHLHKNVHLRLMPAMEFQTS